MVAYECEHAPKTIITFFRSLGRGVETRVRLWV
jgi:hypothetical protein